MPVNYMFATRKVDGTISDRITQLNTVDKEICRVTGQKCNEEKYCQFYQVVIDMAIGALMRTGGSEIKAEHVKIMEDIIDKELNKGREHDEGLMIMRGLVRWLFLVKYQFTAHR